MSTTDATAAGLAAWLCAERLVDADLADADELVAAIEAAGVTDRVARERYGYPSAFALGEAALAHLRPSPRPAVQRPPRYLPAALARGAFCLAAALIATLLTDPRWPAATLLANPSSRGAALLAELSWPIAAAALALAWAGAQALAPIGWAGAPRSGVRLLARRAPDRRRRSLGLHLVAATAQAVAFVLLWLSASGGAGASHAPSDATGAPDALSGGAGPPPAIAPLLLALILVAPLLVALPLVELFAARHAARAVGALDGLDSPAAYRRRIRTLAWRTLAALLPPLLAGVALVAAARRLPFGPAGHPDARAAVLTLACGMLLAGLTGAVAILRVRGRLVAAALVALCPAILLSAPPTALTSAAALPTAWTAAPTAAPLLALAYTATLALLTHALLDTRSFH